MKNKVKTFSFSFIILSFFVFFFLFPSKAFAMSWTYFIDSGSDRWSGSVMIGGLNQDLGIEAHTFEFPASYTILSAYQNDGVNGWQQVTPFTSESYVEFSIPVRYSNLGDYTLGVAVVYKDFNDGGKVKTEVSSNCMHIFNKVAKSFGTTTLTYPTIQQTVNITDGGNYIGTFGGGVWSGDNKGFVLPNFVRDWNWSCGPTTNVNTNSYTGQPLPPTGTWNYNWWTIPNLPTFTCFNNPYNPVTQYTFTFKPAVFDAGQGIGAFSSFNLNNLVVFSRPLLTYPGKTCGSLPKIPTNCEGQYFGFDQCDARADKSKPGICQLNPWLGTINPSNPSDPINYWKWSYCKSGSSAPTPTAAPTAIPTIPPRPTLTPTPRPGLNCQGQYFGKPQCDWRGPATYGSGGTCQLNPALGTINPSNPDDPINYWKWSYCK